MLRRSKFLLQGLAILGIASSAIVSCSGVNEPALGDTLLRPADEMVMVFVPAGKFEMGIIFEGISYARRLCRDTAADPLSAHCPGSAFVDELPAHEVTLDAYWIDRNEVTNQQYQRCVEAGACSPPVDESSYTRPHYYGNDVYADYPVIWITQAQAATYCDWAGGRLPTEAEWEYAARGPEGNTFPWGNTFDGTLLNYCDLNCPLGPKDPMTDDGYVETAPVGSYPSGVSWCGALDMAGNVREWVSDWYGQYALDPQTNPTGPIDGSGHIPRGGCWLDTPDNTRSTNRGSNAPGYTRHKVGFRCAADP
jgi:formylglycine-generating enzyme required for sulfatase activity